MLLRLSDRRFRITASSFTLEDALEKSTLHFSNSSRNAPGCDSGAYPRANDGNIDPHGQCERCTNRYERSRIGSNRYRFAAWRRSNRNDDRHRHDDHRNHNERWRRWPLGLARFARSLRSLRFARRFYVDNLRSPIDALRIVRSLILGVERDVRQTGGVRRSNLHDHQFMRVDRHAIRVGSVERERARRNGAVIRISAEFRT